MKRFLIFGTVLALLGGLAGCGSVASVGFRHPDEVLFNRASDAMEKERFDVAGIMLQTLINTYPESEYASRAKTLLEDPRLARYRDVPTPDVTTFVPN